MSNTQRDAEKMPNSERWCFFVSALFMFSLSCCNAQSVLQCYNCMYTNALTEQGVQCLNPAGIATSQLDASVVQVIGCTQGQCYMYDVTDNIGAHTTIRGCMQSQSQFQCGQQGVTCCSVSDLCNNLDTTPIFNQNLVCYKCQYTNARGIDQNIGCLAPNSNANSNANANISSVNCPGQCFTSVVVANDLVTQTVTRGCTTYQSSYSCSSNDCCSHQSFCNGNSMAYITGKASGRPIATLFVLVVMAVTVLFV